MTMWLILGFLFYVSNCIFTVEITFSNTYLDTFCDFERVAQMEDAVKTLLFAL